jgi:hypothetical protein
MPKMETTNRTIEYGVRKSLWKGKPRFFVIVEGHEHERLNYAKYDFCLQKAENFAKMCYKPHISWTGKEYFTYTYIHNDSSTGAPVQLADCIGS